MEEVEQQDRRIECVECGEVFVFAAGEQVYYKRRDMQNPKRCKKCRILKRQRMDD